MLFVVVCAKHKIVGNRPPQSWRGAQKAAGSALVEKASRWVHKWNNEKTNCNKGVINSLVKSIACCANSSSTSNRHNRLFLHHISTGFYVENLFLVDCEELDDLCAVLEEGMKNRSVGSHMMNDHSSRSHTILTVHITSEQQAENENSVFISKQGKINFVGEFFFLCFIFMTLNYQLEVIFSLGLSHVMDSQNIKSSHKGEKLPKL